MILAVAGLTVMGVLTQTPAPVVPPAPQHFQPRVYFKVGAWECMAWPKVRNSHSAQFRFSCGR